MTADLKKPPSMDELVAGVRDRTYTVAYAVQLIMEWGRVCETEAEMILARALGAQPVPGVEDALTPLPAYGL
jgi:hypothetical protein